VNGKNNNSIYFFTCKLNSPEASYKTRIIMMMIKFLGKEGCYVQDSDLRVRWGKCCYKSRGCALVAGITVTPGGERHRFSGLGIREELLDSAKFDVFECPVLRGRPGARGGHITEIRASNSGRFSTLVN
jgi:hypothetical protein